MRATRRLAAILAADVVGYSRLMGADEEGTLDRLKAHRQELVDPKIEEHRGRIVKTTGDGLLVEFASAVDAVRCAAEIQRGMLDRDAVTSAYRRIVFRIGINAGDIIIDGGDIFGDGVNIAARLEGLAEPGGVYVSAAVHDQVRDKLAYSFEDLGEKTVKNIARPVRVHALSARAVATLPAIALPRRSRSAPLGLAARVAGLLGGGRRARSHSASPVDTEATDGAVPTASNADSGAAAIVPKPPALSIVVLPLTNLSNDPEHEYFVDGITDDLTTDLSRISGSFVIARNTAFTYKGKSVDVKQLGRMLNVRYVLEGSVRRAGEQVSVNVQLIDAGSGAHAWASRFETDRASLPEARDEITGRLARTLNVELLSAAGRRIEQDRLADPDARDLVMRGWALYYRPYSAAARDEARRAFEKALALDPESVDARVGIARILVSNLADGWSRAPAQEADQAEQLLQEALERDMNRADAHAAMGLLRRVQNRLTESRIEYEAAIAFDRNDAQALRGMALTLLHLGEPEAAIPHVEKSIRLNPHDPNIHVAYRVLGSCHALLLQLDEAIEVLRKARAASPKLYFVYVHLAGALGLRGDIDEAKAMLAEGIKLNPELNSIARLRASVPYLTYPKYLALREKTLEVGLRLAGMQDV
ncbi:TolB amino-terminal domain-containing protein [Rhizobiales bacterium GAS191]|nr:TolB amino-terminal domain-containing protein [Rhizobiales bacterium GAS191]